MSYSKPAVCVGCGCTDIKACVKNGEVCWWIRLDRRARIGVCSNCVTPKNHSAMHDALRAAKAKA